ncbi:hypothetical protein [Mesorhizobium sp. CA8]|nr:hypothetical protein [Mesorhizobium sp. CA8]
MEIIWNSHFFVDRRVELGRVELEIVAAELLGPVNVHIGIG